MRLAGLLIPVRPGTGGGGGGLSTASVPLVVSGSDVRLGTLAAPTTLDANADVVFGASATSKKPLVLQGKAGQTANIFETQLSTGAVKFSITSAGQFSTTTADSYFSVGVTYNQSRPQLMWWGTGGAGALVKLGRNAADGDGGDTDSDGIVIWKPSDNTATRIKSDRFGITTCLDAGIYTLRMDNTSIYYRSVAGGGTYRLYINKSTGFTSFGTGSAVGAELFRVTGGAALFDFTGTTAFQVAQTGGGTPALVVDTTNTRVGIGAAPGAYTLDVNGSTSIKGTTATAFLNFTSGSTASVSAAGEARLRYNDTAGVQNFQLSVNGGAFATITTGGVTGSGTINRIPKFTAATVLGDSNISDTGTLVTVTSPSALTMTATTGAVPSVLTVTDAAHTAMTASVERISINFNIGQTREWATGALATQRSVVINAPTYAFVGASIITDAATVAITGAPIAGAFATLTSSYALWVQSGVSRFQGAIQGIDGFGGGPSYSFSSSKNTGMYWETSNIKFAIAGNPRFTISASTLGQIAGAAVGGVVNTISSAAGAHTNQTAGTEVIDYNFNAARILQHATGAIVTQRCFVVQAPTYSFVGASTITTAATLAVTGAPAAGANATLTNSYALWVQGGMTKLEGPINLATLAGAGAQPSAFLYTITGHTSLPAGTEYNALYFNGSAATQTFATGAIATQRFMRVDAPTYAFAAASIITNAATLGISGAPNAGANATITNAYSILVLGGQARFDGSVAIAGTTANAFINFTNGSTAAVSALTEARLRYNNGATQFEASVNGGAWTAFGGGSIGGSGTAGVLPKFTAATTLGDSQVQDTGTVIKIVSPGDADTEFQTVNGASLNIKSISEVVTADSNPFTDSTTNLLPANAFIICVVSRVTTTISGGSTTDFSVGISGDTDRYGTTLALTSGTKSSSFKLAVPLNPAMQNAAAKIRLTWNGGTGATAGAVRVTTYYIDCDEPAS